MKFRRLRRALMVGLTIASVSLITSALPARAYNNYVTNHGSIAFNSGQRTFTAGGLTDYHCPGGGGSCPGQPQYGLYDEMIVTAKKLTCGPTELCPGLTYEVDLGGSGSISVSSTGSMGAPTQMGVTEQQTITTAGPADAVSVPPGRPTSVSTASTTYLWNDLESLESCSGTECTNDWGGAYAIQFETQNCPVSATTETTSSISWNGDPAENSTALDEVSFSGC